MLYPPAGVVEPVGATRQLMLSHLSSLILPACQNPLARTQGLQESNWRSWAITKQFVTLHYIRGGELAEQHQRNFVGTICLGDHSC